MKYFLIKKKEKNMIKVVIIKKKECKKKQFINKDKKELSK